MAQESERMVMRGMGRETDRKGRETDRKTDSKPARARERERGGGGGGGWGGESGTWKESEREGER